MAFLELVRQGVGATRYAIDGDRAVIGRNSDCDVPLDVAAVSRRHAAIVREKEHFFVEDLESRNGTFLNDERVVKRTPLRDGDQLLICGQTFRFHGDHRSAATMEDTSLLDLMDDDSTEAARASVMATFDVSGGSASWRLSAKPEVKLAALLEITNNLGKAMSVEEILPKLLDSLFKIFVQADRGFVVMRPKPGGPLVPVAVKNRRRGGRAADADQPHDRRRGGQVAQGDPVGRCFERRAVQHGPEHCRLFDPLDDLRADDRHAKASRWA